ncbi:caspase domain-containing protein [Streptomyces sp. NBC_00280]|uniref:caspase family protein n=1 Tax=Streptomyces sp. NBC_00280 TaxID=2975699 RepID=UPI0032447764
MRKALIVGIDHYANMHSLSGCVNDAYSVKAAIERNADGTLNFPAPHVLTGTSAEQCVTKRDLKDAVRELFADDSEIALFYFAGHGYIEDTGGFLCATDCETGDDGLALAEVMTLANSSRARNKVVILDSCHSGVAGDSSMATGLAEISDGVTILTASTADQYSYETPGGGAGVFTSLFVDALNGAAANLVGDITPGSVYAHIDQSLGPWAQRPVFKTNVKTFVSLRKTEPPISLMDLQSLTKHFPSPEDNLQLDPSFEPERSLEQVQDPRIPSPDPARTIIFAVLQKYAKVNLVRPVDAPHMWHAAMQSKSCELTVLGQHYWNLVKKGLI